MAPAPLAINSASDCHGRCGSSMDRRNVTRSPGARPYARISSGWSRVESSMLTCRIMESLYQKPEQNPTSGLTLRTNHACGGASVLGRAAARRYNHGEIADSEVSVMRAAVMRNQQIVVAEAPEPEPGRGEVIVKSLACGICGTDLHARKHAETMVEVSRRTGGAFDMDLSRD